MQCADLLFFSKRKDNRKEKKSGEGGDKEEYKVDRRGDGVEESLKYRGENREERKSNDREIFTYSVCHMTTLFYSLQNIKTNSPNYTKDSNVPILIHSPI